MEQNFNTDQNNEQEIKFSEYLRTINQNKWMIIGIFVIVMVLTVIYTVNSPEIFQTSAKVLLEEQKNKGFDFLSQGIGNNTINNTVEIVKSKPVINTAINLLKKYPDSDLFPLLKKQEEEEDFSPIDILIKGIKIDTKRESDMLTISFESTDPKEAMAVVNSVAEALTQQNTQSARLEFTTIREFLETQLDAISRRLQNSEEDLRNYKIESGIFELTEETKKLIEVSALASSSLQAAQTELIMAEKNLVFLKNELSRQDSLLANITFSTSTPFLEQLKDEVVNTQSKITKLQANNEYPETHPEIIKLKKSFENAKLQLTEELKRVLTIKVGSADLLTYRGDLIGKIAEAQINQNIAIAKAKSLQEINEEYNKKMSLLPDAELELARLQRNYTIDEKIHGLLTEKYEDAKVAEQAKMGNVRIIEQASIPKVPIKPRKAMNVLIGIFLGFGLGIGSAFFFSSLDTKIRTLDDVERYVQIPVFGTIPYMRTQDTEDDDMVSQKSGEEQVLLDESTKISARLISHYAPKSHVAESYRTLRTNVISKQKQSGPLCLIISSSGPSEGKSTSIVNLAITMAQMKAKVVIVDLDMRRPMVHNIFELDKENGTSDYLSENEFPLDSIIKKTNIENLSVITSGFIPPNPSEIIASHRMDDLIKELKMQYDFILLDTPPIIAVTDAMILSKKADMLLLVLRVGNTEREIIKRVKDMLKTINSEVTGVIVNGIEFEKYYSGYSYYYYYYYYYYGEKKEDQKKGLFSIFKRKNKLVS